MADRSVLPSDILAQSVADALGLNDRAWNRLHQTQELDQRQQQIDITRRQAARAVHSGGDTVANIARVAGLADIGRGPKLHSQRDDIQAMRGDGSRHRSYGGQSAAQVADNRAAAEWAVGNARSQQELQSAEKSVSAAMAFSQQPGTTIQQREELQVQLMEKYGADVLAQTQTGPSFLKEAAERRQQMMEAQNTMVQEYSSQHGVPAVWDDKAHKPVPDLGLIEAQGDMATLTTTLQKPVVELEKEKIKQIVGEWQFRQKQHDKRLDLMAKAEGANLGTAFNQWQEASDKTFAQRQQLLNPKQPAPAPVAPASASVPSLPPALGRRVRGEFDTPDSAIAAANAGTVAVGDTVKVGDKFYEISPDGTFSEIR